MKILHISSAIILPYPLFGNEISIILSGALIDTNLDIRFIVVDVL